MAITPTGNVDDTRGSNGDFIVGNTATGGLTVDGGSVLSITAPSGQEPMLSLGVGAGITGTGTISGAGSAINLVGNGTQASSGTGINIGRTGTGSLTVTNGALRFTDLVGTTADVATGNGYEQMTVGRGTGANGSLSMTAGTFELVGTGTAISIGRNAGTGTFELLGGSTATVTSRFALGDSTMQIGRDAGGASPTTNANGTMVIDASTFTMTGGGGPGDTNGNTFGAYLQIGRGNATTNGALTLKNNAVLTMNGTNSALGTTVGDSFANIGRGGGTGTVRVESGADWILNGGTDGAGLQIGRNGNPTGSNAEPQTGATGTVVVTGAGSTIVANATGAANLTTGRVSGNTGTMTVESGGVVTMTGQTGAFLNAGIRSFTNDTGNGGTGTINITGGDSAFTVRNNGTASNQFAGINLGTFGGNGTININGGKLTISSASGIFANIGFDGNSPSNTGGTAKITVSNGGTLEYLRTTFASLNIGRGTGSDATVEVLSGGKIRLDAGGINTANSGPLVTIGDRAGVTNAILKIAGLTSLVDGAGSVIVGRNNGDSNSTAGNGQLIIEDSGRLKANFVNIGEGGSVKGHNGQIEAAVALNGGQIGDSAAGATTGAAQTLRIVGSLSLNTGRLSFDVGPGAVENDYIAVTGNVNATPNAQPLFISINAMGTYKFSAGETRVLMTATTGINLGTRTIDETVSGQAAGFSYYLGTNLTQSGSELVIEALNSGESGGPSVLDLGAASPNASTLTYNTSLSEGTVTNGRFGAGAIGNATNLKTVLGTIGNDTFTFDNGGTTGFLLNGRGGSDSITGAGANDTLIGGAGGDSLAGQNGDDLMLGDGPLALSANAGSVRRLYLATLNRGPDDGGWQGWVDQLDGGENLVNIAGGFVDSTEFKRVYGTDLTNEAFVTLLYQNILKRAPDAGGLAANVAALNAGTSRASIVVGLSDSDEFQRNSDFELYSGQIYRLYGATLARMPDTGGFEGWTDQRGENVGLLNISAGFVNSTEFQTTYGNTTDTQFVTLLYNNVLNRAPDAGGLAGWLNELGPGGKSRSEVVLGFSESGEYINNTNAAMRTFVQQQMTVWNDTLIGGAGNDKLSGGRGSDLFVFNQGQGGTDDVFSFDSYDRVQFSGFGYADANAALARMTESGRNVVFTDQGQTITFHDAKLADMQFLII